MYLFVQQHLSVALIFISFTVLYYLHLFKHFFSAYKLTRVNVCSLFPTLYGDDIFVIHVAVNVSSMRNRRNLLGGFNKTK